MTQGVVTVREGRFGPYVTDGETNASLRKGDDVESITIERAAELLADRRARGPATKKKAAKKTTAKKTAAKKATAKKARRQEGGRHEGGVADRRSPPARRELDGRAGEAELRARARRSARWRPSTPPSARAIRPTRSPSSSATARGGSSTSARAPACSPSVCSAAGHEVVAVDPVAGDARPAGRPAARRRDGRRDRRGDPGRRRRRRRGRRRAGRPLVRSGAGRPRDPPGAAARGVLGLIWNTRDERVPWVGALGELLAAEARGHEADQGVVDHFAEELAARRRRRSSPGSSSR